MGLRRISRTSPLSFQTKRHCRLIAPRSVTLIGTAPDAVRYSIARFLFGGFRDRAKVGAPTLLR
jgi:hypothetical protein